MNSSLINIDRPKLRIESDTPAFCSQIQKLILEFELLIEMVEEEKTDVNIIVTDSLEIASSSLAEERSHQPYLVLIIPPSDYDKAYSLYGENDMVYIYKYGMLRNSYLADQLRNLSTKIMANGCSNAALEEMARKLEQQIKLVEDYEESLRLAGEAQQLIMMPHFKDDNFDITTLYRPFQMVSGDVLLIQKVFNKIFIMLADVTNHGYLAGLYGASIYSLANNYVQNSSVAEQNVDAWGQYMLGAAKMYRPYGLKNRDSMLNNFTATMTLCIIDEEKEEASLNFYGSGREEPIIITKENKARVFFSTVSKKKDADLYIARPIGEETFPVKSYTTKFRPGMGLVLYTDGVTEIFAEANHNDKQYSSKKVFESTSNALSSGRVESKDIVNYILQDASAYSITDALNMETDFPNISDDLTLMCIRWKGDYYD